MDDVAGSDDPWDFGAVNQYPVLKFGRNADAIAAQFDAQSPGVPQGVTVTALVDTLIVRWTAASYATGYKVQWKSGGQSYNMTDRQDTVSVGNDTTYAIANLTNGTLYTVRVIATKTGASDSAPSSEVMGVPGIRYDENGNGLIEIGTLAQLNAIRWDLNGDGALDSGADTTAYRAAFPNARLNMGCPANNCIGYELVRDLDFDTDGNGSTWTETNGVIAGDANDAYYNNGGGWQPIGSRTARFNATFDGKGHVIENLFMSRGQHDVGLFSATDTSASIIALGLPDVRVYYGWGSVAALVGHNQGRIAAVYVSGAVRGTDVVGGLVGATNTASSVIVASYSTASVTMAGWNGSGAGLVGYNNTGGVIRASYSTGTVTGPRRAAFLRGHHNAVAASYWDSQSSGFEDDNDADAPEGKTTVELQSPTSATGIYANWDSLDVDGDGTADEHPWTFGASDQYPVLKYAGMDTTAQFATQFAPQGVMVTAFEDSLVVRWTAVQNATGYKVQWKSDGQSYNTTDRQATVSSGSDTTYAIAMLTNGTSYTVRVIATRAGGDSVPSDEVMGVPGIRYDSDGNGLIEIGTLAQLHAMRWDLDGDGAVADSDTMNYNAAFSNAASSTGCPPTGCIGYELAANLTFPASTNSDYNPWSPIYSFNTTLEGNGRTLTDLNVKLTTSADVGLFGSLGGSAIIRNLGLVNPTVVSSTGDARSHGIVAGHAPSGGDTINAVYILGGSITTAANTSNAGALIGLGSVAIRASYSTASVRVSGDPTGVDIGGLVGELSGGSIIASYAAGAVAGGTGSIGGLVGKASGGTITASYCDTSATDQANCIGSGTTDSVYSTTQLQTPTGYAGIYTGWNLDLDGISGNDDPWTFGASDQYPVLKYAGMDTIAQFTAQPPGVPQGVTLTALVESLDVRWTAVNYATGYKVQWKSGMQTYDAASRQSLVSGTRATIPMLTAGTTYTVRVIATKTGARDGRPSAEQTGIPKFPPPGVPGNVMVTPYVRALRVTWDAATSADGYKVQWKAGDQAYAPATREYAVGGTDTTIVGLTAGTSYTVRVLATREHADDGVGAEAMGTPLAIPSLSITSPDVAEGATGAMDTLRFAVTLSHASQHEVTVAYAMGTGTATAGTDYTALTDGTLTLAPGALSDTLAVAVIGDGTDEPDETVIITLNSPTNATFVDAASLTGTGRITDDDAAVATLVLSPPAISENNGITTVTATLSSPEEEAVTITVSATPEDPAIPGDFTLSTARTLTIAADSLTSTGLVTITANDNNARAATKSVTVSGTADDTPDVVAPPAPVTLTITDDESAQVTLVLSPAAISENGGVATVTATLSSAENAATAITVSATAVAPADTTDFSLSSAKTLTIAAASLTSTGLVTIAAQDDTLDAPDKSVTVSGTADGGNNATAPRAVTLTITDDDDPPTLSITSPSLDEGNTGSASLSFGVMLSAASEKQITVAYAMGTGAATAGEDYTALADGTLTFAPGTTSLSLAVSIIGDETDEPDETVIITLSTPTNATFTGDAAILAGRGTITDDDPAVATLVLSPEAISENGGITTVTATLSTPENAAVTITISATPEGHAVIDDFTLSTAKTLTIAADSLTSTGLVTITANDNNARAATKSVTVSGTADDTPDVVAPPAPVTLTITDDDDLASIPDAGLRAVIEDSLNKAIGEPITLSEMATLTRLIAPNKNIRDLTGLEFATGLDTLNLADNNIEDIEPLVDNAGLGTGAAIDLRGNPLNAQSRDVHVPALEARGVSVHVQPTTNMDVDADGTADLTDAIMVILYLFGLENEGITDYILFSDQAQRTDPQAVTAYIKTLINTRRIDIDDDGTVDLTDIIMVILYLFGLENEGITNYILFSAQATRTDPQAVTAYIASLLP